MKIHIIQNVLQSVLTLINRLCIAICLKFYQSNILVLAITLTTKAWAPKILAHNEKKNAPSRIEKMAPKKKNKVPSQRRKKGPLCEKQSSPPPSQERKKGLTNRLFSRGTRQVPTLVTPLSATINKCEPLIYNQNTL